MKSIQNNTLFRTLALGVLMACLGAAVAHAETFRGKFSLQSQVRWGAATLPAGDYTFRSEGVMSGNSLRLFREGHLVATLLPQGHNPAVTGSAVLVIDVGKGGRTVREVRMPEIGLVLYFDPHKPRHGTATEERLAAQAIPITVAGTR